MTQRRWLALCGVVSPILIALAFFVVDPGSSDGSQSAAKVMSTYRGDKSAGVAAAYMVVIAAVLLVMFAARLREVLYAGEISGGALSLAALRTDGLHYNVAGSDLVGGWIDIQLNAIARETNG